MANVSPSMVHGRPHPCCHCFIVSNRKLQVSVTKLMTLEEVMSDRDSEDVITF